MAMTTHRNSDAFSVQGRIFDVTTKQGIGGLLITVYDLNGGAGRGADSGLDALLRDAKRVGSVPSDEDGEFTLKYDRDDILAISSEKRRLDLLLVVTAPDDEKSGAAEKVIYYSNPPRMHAGREETFNVGISRSSLKKFGLGGDVNVKEKISSYRRERTDERELAEGVVDFHRADMVRDREEKKALRAELFNTIATNVEVATLHGELVRGNGSLKEIKDKMDAVAGKAVALANTQINTSEGVPVNLYLTEEDRNRLQPFFDNAVGGFAAIPEHEIRDILFRPNSSDNPGTLLVHQNPIAKFCLEHTFEEKCAKIHTGLAEGEAHHNGAGHGGGNNTGSEVAPLSNEDIPKHIARLVKVRLRPTASWPRRSTRSGLIVARSKTPLTNSPSEKDRQRCPPSTTSTRSRLPSSTCGRS